MSISWMSTSPSTTPSEMRLKTLMAAWMVLSTLSVALEFPPIPAERFFLTSCNIYRTFSSNGSVALLGPLKTMQPELFRCDPLKGLSLDVERLSLGSSDVVALETKSNMENFGTHLKKGRFGKNVGMSISTWFSRTAEYPDRIQPIVAIGVSMTSATSDSKNHTGCPGFDFMIAQFKDTILLQYTSSETVASGYRCHSVRASALQLEPTALTHVTVVFAASETMLYVNGNAVLLGIPNHFPIMLGNWNLSASNLQLFTAPIDVYESFHGSIYQVDLFDQALEFDSVVSLYGEGFLPVEPYVVSVTARLDETHSIYQQNTTTNPFLSLHIGSWNETASVFQLEVELLSLPQHGRLIYNETLVNRTTLLRYPIDMGANAITLNYQPVESNYFNFPSMNMYGRNTPFSAESFDFRIRAYDFKRKLIAISPTITQPIDVVHVNHPGFLTGPNQALLDVMNPTEAIVPSPIEYLDSFDYDTEYVRVDLWAEHGVLSLQVDGLRLADFDSCRDRMDFGGQWQCAGDGKRNSNMTFIAIPSDIRAILRYLTYHRLPPGLADQIHVQVWDGTGEEMCLSPSEQSARLSAVMSSSDNSTVFTKPVQDRCYYQHIIVEIPGYNASDIDPLEPIDEERFNGFLGFLSIADLLFWGLVCSVIVFCALCCRHLPRCSARGRAVDVSSSNDIEEETSIPTPTDLDQDPFTNHVNMQVRLKI